MPVHLTPDSWGTRTREFNPYHDPKTGRFSTKNGPPGPAGAEFRKSRLMQDREAAIRSLDTPRPREARNPKFMALAAEIANDPQLTDAERRHANVLARAYLASQKWFEKHGGKDSLSSFTEMGPRGQIRYTDPSRKAVLSAYAQRIAEVKAQQPAGKPTMLVTGGLGGAGKTAGLKQSGIDRRKFVEINSDDIKAMLPEYDGYNAGWLHEESDYLTTIALDMARKAGVSVIFDATLKSDSAVSRVQKFAETHHVDVQFTSVVLDGPNGAIERTVHRLVKEGRFVPPSFARGAQRKFFSDKPGTSPLTGRTYRSQNEQTFDRFAREPWVRNAEMYDNMVNIGEKPKLVWRKS